MKTKKFKVSVSYEAGRGYILDETIINYAIFTYLEEIGKVGRIKNSIVKVEADKV